MGISVRATEAGDWAAVAAVFARPGDQATCWCQWFRAPGRVFGAASTAERSAALRAEVEAADPEPGVLAFEDGAPVGWAGVGPRDRYPRLRRSPLLRGLDDPGGVWSVTCFVVPAAHRGRGLTTALLQGAVDHAGASGAETIEAYPVDATVRTGVTASELYHGPLSLFERAGFRTVARPSAARAVVRLAV